MENDICLIYTDNPIEYGYGAEPICIPDDNYEIIDGEECYTAGWGKSSYNGAVNLVKVFSRFWLARKVSQSDYQKSLIELTEVGVPIIDAKTCFEWYR